jgi:DNA-directed RNA polymerase specialized sigma subunit
MTKEQLRNFFALQKEIRELEEELFELSCRAQKMTSVITDEPRGGNDSADRMADTVAKIVDVRDSVNDLVQKANAEREQIERELRTLPPGHRCLVRLRYVRGMTWEKIAVHMNYSWRQVHRIHGEALKMLAGEQE